MTETKISEAIVFNRGRFIALGALLVITGLIAIVFPFASTIAIELVVGISLLIAGFGQIVLAFGNRDWSGFLFVLFVGAMWLVAGLFLVVRPAEGAAILTLFITVTFVAEGISRIIFAFQMNSKNGWIWMLMGGVIAIVAGTMLYAQFPFSATWALGLLAGINISFAGWTLCMLALAAENEGTSSNTAAAT